MDSGRRLLGCRYLSLSIADVADVADVADYR
jgi:hypothetical protein